MKFVVPFRFTVVLQYSFLVLKDTAIQSEEEAHAHKNTTDSVTSKIVIMWVWLVRWKTL